MTALKAGALVLVIRSVFITGDAHIALAVSGPGASVSYDNAARLLIATRPTPETLRKLYLDTDNPGRAGLPAWVSSWSSAPARLPSDGFAMTGPLPGQQPGLISYLDEVEPGLYRKRHTEEIPGFAITLGRTHAPLGAEDAVSPRITLTYQVLAGGKYEPDLGAYVGRPTVDRKDVSVAPPMKLGEAVMLVWQPSPDGDLDVDLPVGVPVQSIKAPDEARRPPGPPPGGLPIPGPLSSVWTEKLDKSVPLAAPPVHPRMVVLLELTTRADEEGPARPPGAALVVKAPVEAAMQDRDYLEAELKVLDAQVKEAEVKASAARRKYDIAVSKSKAGQMSAADLQDQQSAYAVAQAELERVTAETDAQRALVRRLLGKLPAESVRVVAVGEVRQPGVYVLPLNSTLRDLLTKAGGPTERADAAHAELLRTAQGGQAVTEVDLGAYVLGKPAGPEAALAVDLALELESGDVLLLPSKLPTAPLRPGDTIYLPARPASPPR